VLAGYVGIPHALGGSNWFERFLAPSFTAGAAHEGEHAAPDAGLELTLMAVSTVVALAGIWLAAQLFLRRRELADALALRFPRIRTLLLRKYYVDEIYDQAIVQPLGLASEEGLWKTVDQRAIDGTVNGIGGLVAGTSDLVRRLQSGSVRAYAASLFAGVVLVLGYYLWR
jgi:NADH-quinone oxidoreductase subunit L